MTYQNIQLLNEFTDDEHKQIYYDNIMRILGVNDLILINKLLLTT
jgi:hypothetical protein